MEKHSTCAFQFENDEDQLTPVAKFENLVFSCVKHHLRLRFNSSRMTKMVSQLIFLRDNYENEHFPAGKTH